MCGVTGFINLDFQPIHFNVLKQMSDVQKHRGPDDQGFVGFSFPQNKIEPIDGNSKNSNAFHGGIGFNRLSILDLSMNGHQPMISENGKIAIAYNGETYNAFQLKPHLEKKGYRFKSNTDTEVVLYLYQEYGIEKMLELVNGMFGFCIVDLNLQKLFLARDHVGIKPMYWYKKDKTILFASEIKTFLQHPTFSSEIEKENLDEYFYYKYTAFDRTLFRGVRQIPAGHFIEISVTGEKLNKYWEPDFSVKYSNKEKALLELGNVLKTSVNSQLISDVKVGCQLSGGIDSSLVTTFAREAFDANMDTFSILLENKKYSEEKYIDQVIERTNPVAHKFNLNPDYFAKNVAGATWHLDVPLPIPQTVGLKRLAESSSDFVTVLLSGEGSDELMGGYVQHYNQAFKSKNKLAISLLSKVPVKGKKIEKQYMPNVPAEDYFMKYRAAVHLDEFNQFMPEANLEKVFNQRKQLFPEHADPLLRTRFYDMKTWLVNILNMQDKMTMAHSIENRVPFLDKNLINLVFSLPTNYFVKSSRNPFAYNSPNKHTKILLKKLTTKYYNKEFVYRTKMGFNQPLNDYFSNPLMKEFINDLILPGMKNRGIVDYKKIETVWNRIIDSGNYYGTFLMWTCFSFELWAQIFIDRSIRF